MTNLWEIDHPYYCNAGNYYSNDASMVFESWDDFLTDLGDGDLDYNMVFRWDWNKCEETGDQVHLAYMLQRKGIYLSVTVKVTDEDQDAVREFLKPRWEYMKRLWEGMNDD